MKTRMFGAVFFAVAMIGCPAQLPGTGAATGAGGLTGGAAGTAGLTGGGEAAANCSGDFGDSAAAKKLEAFLDATQTFVGTASDLQNSLRDSCKQMGSALGLSDADMAPSAGQSEAKAACDAVSSKLHSELSDLRAHAHLRIKIISTPPHCDVGMDAYAGCAASCDANLQPGHVDVHCQGGEIVGTCSGQCSGSCVANVSAHCAGKCEGTCGASCTGVCQGTCDGTCASHGANGQCNGRCTGTCHGTCTAGCTGECSGSCEVSHEAHCDGECHGGCSVAYTAPRCTGHVVPPHMSAQCKASCNAKVQAHATCTAGHTEVVIRGNIGSNIVDRVNKVRAAIEAGFDAIKAVEAKLHLLAESGQEMVQTAHDVPGAVGTLGMQAVQCATNAVGQFPQATASISVSVQVSASVSGSVGG